MSKSRWDIVTLITLAFLVIGWVLLLLPSITSVQDNLSLATVSSGDLEPATFGILDWNGGGFGSGRSSAFSTNTRSNVGYRASLDLPFNFTNPINPDRPPEISRRPYTVTYQEDTEPLIMFPVSLGILAVAIICFITSAAIGNSAWLGTSVLFSLVATVMAWVGWGFAYQLTPAIEDNLRFYYMSFGSVLTDINVERGNAIWPGLVGAILVSLATILGVYKVATRPYKKDNEDIKMRNLSSQTGTKTADTRERSSSSDSTLAENTSRV